MLFPLYHVLADAGDFAGSWVVELVPSQPLQVEGLALTDGVRVRLLVANLSAEPHTVSVQQLPVAAVRVRYLDEDTFERAALHGTVFRAESGEWRTVVEGTLDIDLKPFAVARIDADIGAA